MQNSAWEKYKNVENEKSLWCTKQAGQWSNGGRIVKWWLWQKLWTKIFFRSHFLKIYGPQVPILCPSCRQQWVFFSRLATELEFPLLKGFVLPPHFQVRRGTFPSKIYLQKVVKSPTSHLMVEKVLQLRRGSTIIGTIPVKAGFWLSSATLLVV